MALALDEQKFIEQIIRSPRLPLVTQKLQQVLADEKSQREAFYNQITESDKAEYINGEIIFHSPVKLRHNLVGKRLLVLLDTHVQSHSLGVVAYEEILIALSRNDYEPDLCFFNQDKAAQFSDDQMRFPPPDFVVEILSTSTESNDRGVKFEDYADHGVHEYWIIDPSAEILEQYLLVDGSYKLQIKSGTGEVISVAVPHFTIPIRALFDDAINRETLQSFLSDKS